MTTVYLFGPIRGLSYKQATGWRIEAENRLREVGFDVISPLFAKEYLAKQKCLKGSYEQYALSTTHAIYARDYWSVQISDILLGNFLKAKLPSFGSIMEMAWGWNLGRFIVLAMENRNIHDHPFIREAASVITPTIEEAVDIVIKSKPHEGRAWPSGRMQEY